MAILIDPPAWPAHGRLWSHLISDTNYAELHDFAKLLNIPRRSFDLDHYDVPENLYEQAILLGALPVSGREIVFALQGAGLRVRQVEQELIKPVRRLEFLRDEWLTLGSKLELPRNVGAKASLGAWEGLGDELLERWREPHRHYHDERHLEDVLLALDQLETYGEEIAPETLLAAWFHDAIYRGVSSQDERDSADFVANALRSLGFNKGINTLVQELVLATDPAQPTPSHSTLDLPFAHLLDSDIWVFASLSNRYQEYVAGIRQEYAHVSPADFSSGRSQILRSYLEKPRLYNTDWARQFWEPRARANVANEIEQLAQSNN